MRRPGRGFTWQLGLLASVLLGAAPLACSQRPAASDARQGLASAAAPSPGPALALEPAAAPGAPAEASGSCCQRLAAIGFTSNLPVVVLDSSSQAITFHVDTPLQLCTCNSGMCGGQVQKWGWQCVCSRQSTGKRPAN